MFAASAPRDGRTRVKICGITNADDAQAAIEAGADALGWNFSPRSKRFIAPRDAIALIDGLEQSIAHVAVVVDPTFEEAVALASCGRFAALQLHGDETPKFCQQLMNRQIRFAKALAVRAETFRQPINAFGTETIILDSAAAGSFGGTGEIFPWQRAVDVIASYPEIRVSLAGGLTPENVAEAVRVVRPFGVDVTTGVESSPGRKDQARLRDFIAAVRSA